jgi:hypothetical protein
MVFVSVGVRILPSLLQLENAVKNARKDLDALKKKAEGLAACKRH